MKFKRLISMFLSLAMIISCLTAIPTIAQAEVTGFTNLVDDPGFDGTYADGYDKSEWVMSGSAEGKITIETDTKDSTNKVLRIDCSENTKNISYVNFKDESTGIAKGTYYMYCKVRLAQKDATTDANHYFLANSMSGLTTNYNATRPAITKDGWAECYGKFTVTSDNASVGFKIISQQSGTNSTSKNVAKAVYEIDDIKIYNMADAKTITLPAGANFASDNVVKAHDNKYYANAGSAVSVTYEKDGYTLTGADFTQNGNTYTFTMGSSDVTISEIEKTTSAEFVNVIKDPGFDGTLDANWSMNTYATGDIEIVTDKKDATNTVLRVDCTDNTKNISYVEYQNLPEGTYYLHCKIRLADVDQPAADNYYVYENRLSGQITKYPNAVAPEVTKDDWAECYGVFKKTAAQNIGFKITSERANSANIKDAIYEIDDVVIYNLATAKNITVPEDVEFTSDNVVKSHDNTYYAVQGSEVAFTYAKDGYTLSAEGAELAQNGNAYTFTVDATDVTITEQAPAVTEFKNLVADPGFDGTLSANWSMNTYATGNFEKVTKADGNNVLRADFTENTKNISYIEYQNLDAGTYYMSCKIRLADDNEADTAYVYVNRLGGVDNIYWDAVRPAVTKGDWSECYGVFTKTATQNIGFKIIASQGNSNDNISKAIYEIDDFKVYDLANANNIAVPTGVEFTSDNVVKSHDSTYYAINGNEVTFNYAGEGLEALYIDGEEATATEGVYSHTVEADTLVLAVANQAEEGTVKYAYTAGTPYAIFTKDATVTLIVAGHSDEGVLNSMNVAVIAGTAGEILDLSTVEEFEAISGWANKTVFTWDGVATLNPIRGKCVLKDL